MDFEPVAVLNLSKWGWKWINYGFRTVIGDTSERQHARRMLGAFDASTEEPATFIEYNPVKRRGNTVLASDLLGDVLDSAGEPSIEVVTRVHTQQVVEISETGPKILVDNQKTTKRIKRGRRTKFAMAIAKKAYMKFGARAVNEANILVVRKWVTKLLEEQEYADLRTCDKINAIDRATFLSFIPTMAWNNCKFVFHGDNAITARIGGESLFSRIAHWANPGA
jgi:hypothetical protein